MKFILTVFIVVINIYISFAQQSEGKKVDLENNEEYKFIIKSAEKFFSMGDYHNALDWYEEALHKDSNNVSVLLNTAICHLDLYADMESIYYLKKANSILQGFSPDYHYWLGSAFHLNLHFDSASYHYEKFLLENKDHPEKKSSIIKLIEETVLGKKYLQEGKKYYSDNIKTPINGEYSEKNPVWSINHQTLFFNSNRTDGKEKSEITDKGDAYEHIYFSEVKNDKFSYPKILKEVNKEKTNSEIITFYDKGNKMLICRSGKSKKLYLSEMIGNSWSEPSPFFDDDKTLIDFSWIFLSENGSKIIFSSKSDGEGGNLDLYGMEKSKEGIWGKPKILSELNSSEDESFPFLLNDSKTLFFSSKRNSTMGGYDIYKCEYNIQSATWSEPVNLGYPMNTPGDDIFSGYNEKENNYLLTSNRSGGRGEFDIYSVKEYGQVNIKGNISIKNLKTNTDGYLIEFSCIENANIKKVNIKNNSFYTFLGSNQSYKASILDKDGKVLLEETFFIPPVKTNNSEFVKDFNIEVKTLLKVENAFQMTNRYLIKINYDTNKPFLINGIIKENGSRKINQKYKIYLHNYADHKILAETESNSLGQYYFVVNPIVKNNYRLEIKSSNHLSEWISIISLDSIPRNSNETEMKKNRFNSINLSNNLNKNRKILARLYFQLNNADINKADEGFLTSIAEYLNQSPKSKLIIKGFDDNTGAKLVNSRISHQRAENVEKYFLKMGISQDRLTDKGMGSDFFAAPNEEEINGRDNNRRVEIEVIE